MAPIILTLAVLSASCALTTALALAWGCRQSRPSAPLVMLLADPVQGVHRQRYLRARANARHKADLESSNNLLHKRARAAARQRHPLRLHHIRVGGQPLTRWLRLIGGGLLLTLILLTLAFL